MWQEIWRRIPSWTVLINAALAAIIPWAIIGLNNWLHQKGDPPWKKNGQTNNE